jgi:hypothetical protein
MLLLLLIKAKFFNFDGLYFTDVFLFFFTKWFTKTSCMSDLEYTFIINIIISKNTFLKYINKQFKI